MAMFVISYDLHKEKDYTKLWEALEGVGAHRALESLWLATLDNTPQQVVEWLSEYVDSDDSLFVAETTGRTWFKNGKAGTNSWIKGHFR